MYSLLHQNRHLPGHSGTGKPTGIRDIRMRYFYAYLIIHLPETHLFTDIIIKRHISIRTLPQIIAVAPYLAVLINPVKQQPDLLTPIFLRQGKTHPVPPDPSGQIPRPAGIRF